MMQNVFVIDRNRKAWPTFENTCHYRYTLKNCRFPSFFELMITGKEKLEECSSSYAAIAHIYELYALLVKIGSSNDEGSNNKKSSDNFLHKRKEIKWTLAPSHCQFQFFSRPR